MRYKVLKNKETGLYFGHLSMTYDRIIEYTDIKLAYRFLDFFEYPNYNMVYYDNELRKQKLKKLCLT